CTDQAGAQWQHQSLILTFVGPNDEFRLQQALFLIEKKNGKGVVVDLLLHRRSNLVHQLVDFERRAHFQADVVQQSKQFAVSVLAVVHARILDSDSDLACEEVQQLDLLFAKISK